VNTVAEILEHVVARSHRKSFDFSGLSFRFRRTHSALFFTQRVDPNQPNLFFS
jgi:hypothetical protein